MIDPDEVICPFCGVTGDGLQHRFNCPVLVYDDSDDPEPSDGMTPPEMPPEPVPTDQMMDDKFHRFLNLPD